MAGADRGHAGSPGTAGTLSFVSVQLLASEPPLTSGYVCTAGPSSPGRGHSVLLLRPTPLPVHTFPSPRGLPEAAAWSHGRFPVRNPRRLACPGRAPALPRTRCPDAPEPPRTSRRPEHRTARPQCHPPRTRTQSAAAGPDRAPPPRGRRGAETPGGRAARCTRAVGAAFRVRGGRSDRQARAGVRLCARHPGPSLSQLARSRRAERQ